MAYPFESVQRLLAWGIPSIRSAGRDYAYRNVAGINTLSSVAGSGEPGATLRAEFGPRSRTLELREGSSGRLVFARRWNLEVIGGEVHFFCPDYSESPRETEQPRLLLMQALGLNGIDSQALAEGRGHFYKDLFISQDVESAASMFVIPKRVRAQHAY